MCPQGERRPRLGRGLAPLAGRLLFGDVCVGFVRVLQVDDGRRVLVDGHVGHIDTPVDVHQGPDGYVYALSFGTCGSVVEDPPESKLYRAVLEP